VLVLRAGRAPIAGERYTRAALAGAGLLLLSITAGFYFRSTWATELWPWPDSRLSYLFLASILAAIALPTLWIAISGDLSAIQAGALNLAVVYGGACIYFITLLGDPGQPALAPYAAAFGAAFLASVGAFLVARRIGVRDQRPGSPGASTRPADSSS
jgi:hypothetical protein